LNSANFKPANDHKQTVKMNHITFRRAVANDAQTLANLRIQFAIELSGDQPEAAVELLRAQMVAYFLKATNDNTCISVLAECNGQVCGIGSVHIREVPGNFRNLSGKWGYVMNMYTVSEFRRKGASTGILELLQEEGRKAGVTAFELHATEAGKPVYLKDGFQYHNEPTLRKFYP
jgi:hypothetical protein